MLGVYLATMGFGSVLIGVSMFFGGTDKDFDKDFDVEGDVDLDGDVDHDVDLDGDVEVDVDHDVDLDHDVEGVDFMGDVEAELEGIDKDLSGIADFIWLPILSMRFWTFGSAAFGFTGTVLTLGGLHLLMVLLLSTVFGGTTGTAAAYFFRALKKDTVTSATSLKSFVGEEARVLLPIQGAVRGKIVLDSPSGRVEMMATSRDTADIPVGATVILAGIRDGVADVSALDAATDEVLRRQARKAHKNESA